ncbi:cell division protein FtsL [Lachnospiraceae bacterium KM106-2]|nr:cell division protein FtsL [Lachnospiraceae bacterium KM106-2]
MSAEKKYQRYEKHYIDGNTVRKLQTAPDYERQRQLDREEFYRKQKQERRRQRERQRRLERTRGLDFFSVCCLSVALVFTLMACVGYLHMNTSITASKNKIATLQSQVLQLEGENAAIQDEKMKAVDLSKVYQYASIRLGMVLPGKDQVITYHSAINDYVKQYGEIPRTEDLMDILKAGNK